MIIYVILLKLIVPYTFVIRVLQILPNAYQAFAKMVALAGMAKNPIAYARLAWLEKHVTVTTPI